MISTIITNYNNGGLLREAVSSVLNQSYRDLEVIIVDDCSTDDSIENIRREFSADERLKILMLEENHGPGYARDYGLRHSSGEWISFVDGDDYIYPDFYKELIKATEENNGDIYSCKMNIDGTCRGLDFCIITDKQDMIDHMMEQTNHFLNNKIVRRELFFPYGYCKTRYIEDTPTMVKCLMKCRREVFIPYIGYYYRNNPSSLTHTSSATKTTLYYSLAMFNIHETIIDAGYKSHIDPVFLSKDLVLQGEHGLLDGQEIEEKFKDDFNLLNTYVDKYYPKEIK